MQSELRSRISDPQTFRIATRGTQGPAITDLPQITVRTAQFIEIPPTIAGPLGVKTRTAIQLFVFVEDLVFNCTSCHHRSPVIVVELFYHHTDAHNYQGDT
jgi:hypothetical protein